MHEKPCLIPILENLLSLTQNIDVVYVYLHVETKNLF